MDEVEVEVVELLVVTTESSVWHFTPTHFARLPRSAHPRAPLDIVEGALLDGDWREHAGIWKFEDPFGTRYRVLPMGREGHGIITGVVQEESGA